MPLSETRSLNNLAQAAGARAPFYVSSSPHGPGPAPQQTPKQQLPDIKRWLGSCPVNFVKVYNRDGLMMKAVAKDGDNPRLHLAIEGPRPHYTQQRDTELHMGISGHFRLEQIRRSTVQPSINCYMPLSSGQILQQALQAYYGHPSLTIRDDSPGTTSPPRSGAGAVSFGSLSQFMPLGRDRRGE